tara:strand:+ start:54 stop:398 length:345 start_codon:yes stop_codon:yes gene_type:complete
MPNIGTLGWAYITGSVVAIDDGGTNRIPFYKDDTTLSGSADITFDSQKKLTVTGSVATDVVLAGAFSNATTIAGPTTVPANHNSLLYGPITVGDNGTLTISVDAVVKIKDFGDV